MATESGSPRRRFESELANLEVPVTRTNAAELGTTLREVVREPAVGTPLPFETATLPEWIDTEATPATLEAAETGVTAASFGVADYGSVVLPATPEGSEQVSLFPRLHVPILREGSILPDMRSAIDRLGPRLRDGESAILATGPSATADMGDLVRGAHGPEAVHVVVLADDSTADHPSDDSTADRPADEAEGVER